MKRWHAWLALAATIALALAASPAGAAPAGTFTTVVSGLDNPRDLAFSPPGQSCGAGAGPGGPPLECVIAPPESAFCPGFTGGISRIDVADGTATRVVSGLASVADEAGFSAVGIDGISFHGDGGLFG